MLCIVWGVFGKVLVILVCGRWRICCAPITRKGGLFVECFWCLYDRVDVLKSNPEWADVELKKGDEVSDPEVMIRRIVKWFHCYFNDPLTLKQNFPKSVEICVTSGTPFQREIWKALQEGVEFGNTLSYGELAAVVNKPSKKWFQVLNKYLFPTLLKSLVTFPQNVLKFSSRCCSWSWYSDEAKSKLLNCPLPPSRTG